MGVGGGWVGAGAPRPPPPVPSTRDTHCTAYQRECMSVDVTCRCVCVRRCVCICVRVCVCACVRVHVYVRMGK